MKRFEKENRIDELLDNMIFGEKMIQRGEATREELKYQLEEIELELIQLGYVLWLKYNVSRDI